MATIDIPDKICPHCSSTRWYIYKNSKSCLKCKMERDKKYSRMSINKNYYEKRKLTDEHKNYSKKYHKALSVNLHDIHIKKSLVYKGYIKYSEIPQQLIELKRKQLLLTRQINNHENKNVWLL